MENRESKNQGKDQDQEQEQEQDLQRQQQMIESLLALFAAANNPQALQTPLDYSALTFFQSALSCPQNVVFIPQTNQSQQHQSNQMHQPTAQPPPTISLASAPPLSSLFSHHPAFSPSLSSTNTSVPSLWALPQQNTQQTNLQTSLSIDPLINLSFNPQINPQQINPQQINPQTNLPPNPPRLLSTTLITLATPVAPRQARPIPTLQSLLHFAISDDSASSSTAPPENTRRRTAFNSYVVYTLAHREAFRRADPFLSNRELTRRLAQEWATVPSSEKQLYKRLARDLTNIRRDSESSMRLPHGMTPSRK